MLAGIVTKSRRALAARIAALRGELLTVLRYVRPSAPVLLLWLGLALALGVVSGFAAGTERFPADLWLTRRVQDIDVTGFSRTARIATNLSSPNYSAVAFLGAVGILFLVRQPRLAFFAAASAWTHALGGLLKVLVDRPRPSSELVDTIRFEADFSYPSGHIEWVVGFEGFLVFAVWQLVPNRLVRSLVTAAWVVHIAFTSLGRIDQGLHWPSDVLGGALVGALALSVTVWAYVASRRAAAIANEPPEQTVQDAPAWSASTV